jgi:hypothetical protein
MTSSMPDLGGDRASGGLVVAGQQHRAQPERLQRGDASAEVGLTVSATTSTARTSPSQAARPRCGPGCSAAAWRRRARRDAQTPLGHQRRRADEDAWPSTTPSTPEALAVGEALDRGRAPELVARGAAMAWAIGCSDASSSAPAIRSTSARSPSGRGDLDQAHLAGGDRAGLVEHDVSTLRVDSRTSGPLISSPSCAPRPGADQQRGRGREPERARAGDDEHGDGGGDRERQALARPSQKPERGEAMPMTTGTNTPEMRSARRCTGRLAGLRVGDELGDLRQRGVGADARGLDDQAPAGVDARAGDVVAGLLLDRHDSPVSSDWSTAEVPSTTTPSVATFSPGRTTKRSPTASCSIGTRARAVGVEHGRRPWRPARAAP